MKNLVVFLHGKGGDKTVHADFLKTFGIQEQADILTFNAPFSYKDGYLWFSKERKEGIRYANKQEFEHSIEFIMDKIKKTDIPLENIIVLGHSQGGCMAMALGLLYPFKKVIGICGDLPYDLTYQTGHVCQNIVWVEGGSDTYLSDDRKQSYQILNKKGIKFYYIKSPHTGHNQFSSDLLKEIQ